jgi:hypothetical protein
VGYSVVRLYLFSMACSKAGSIVAVENEVRCSVEHSSADPEFCWVRSGTCRRRGRVCQSKTGRAWRSNFIQTIY